MLRKHFLSHLRTLSVRKTSAPVENSKNVSPILDTELLGEIFNEPGSFKEFARERMEHKLDILSDYDF